MQLLGNVRIVVDLVQIRFHCHNFLDLIRLEHRSLHHTLDPDYSVDGQNRNSNHENQIDPLFDFPAGVNIVDHKAVADNTDDRNQRAKGQLESSGGFRQTLPKNQHIKMQNDVGEDPESTARQNQECQLIAGGKSGDVDENHCRSHQQQS